MILTGLDGATRELRKVESRELRPFGTARDGHDSDAAEHQDGRDNKARRNGLEKEDHAPGCGQHRNGELKHCGPHSRQPAQCRKPGHIPEAGRKRTRRERPGRDLPGGRETAGSTPGSRPASAGPRARSCSWSARGDLVLPDHVMNTCPTPCPPSPSARRLLAKERKAPAIRDTPTQSGRGRDRPPAFLSCARQRDARQSASSPERTRTGSGHRFRC